MNELILSQNMQTQNRRAFNKLADFMLRSATLTQPTYLIETCIEIQKFMIILNHMLHKQIILIDIELNSIFSFSVHIIHRPSAI